MITEKLQTLNIHQLSQEQYDRVKAAGNTDGTALYLTPDDTADYVVEQGVTDTYGYRKWNSGASEYWGKVTDELQLDSGTAASFGSFYLFSSMEKELPGTAGLFCEVPITQVSCSIDVGYHCIASRTTVVINENNEAVLNQAVFVDLGEDPNYYGFNVTYSIYAVGRWKKEE